VGKLKTLILGDGLLGSEMVKQSGWDYVSRKYTNFNIHDLENSIPEGYNVIVNCIANTDTYNKNKDAHWEINYVFVGELIKYCNEKDIKLVQISTDYLYAGSIENASEEDVPVHCNTWYGYTKLLSDGLVQLQSNCHLICRCTHKPTPFPYDNAWEDQIGNFDYVDVISKIIINMINEDLEGVYNVGTDRKTMYELASQTKDVERSKTPVHVPKNQSMNVSKLNKDLNKPFFSIAIPTYEMHGKGVEFLEISFEKIYQQTFKNFEVVISDHSKDDEIKKLCNKWCKKINVKYNRNENGLGKSSSNINNAIKLCNGKWIKILFQDDFLFNNESLETYRKFIIENKKTKWFVSGCQHTNDGVSFYRKFLPSWNDKIHLGVNSLSSPSVLCIKNNSSILFDEHLIWMMDIDFYKKFHIKYGSACYIQEVLVVNRTWGDSVTNTISKERKEQEQRIMIERYEK